MKKKLLALLCVMSVLVGVFAFSATTATAAEEKFYVGYAKVDINPYYDEEKEDLRIMPVPLRGLGSPQTRLAYEYLVDDNGSNGVDYIAEDGTGGDGLFLTCIAISNSKDSFENAVFLFTMDAIGDMGHTAAAREAIVKNLGTTYGIAADQIMVSGTHSHSGVDLTQLDSSTFKNDTTADVEVVMADGTSTYKISGSTAYGYLQTYWDRLINKFVVAAEAAIDDCTEATVKKGQIEVDESTAASSKTMNFVRHYVAEDGSNGYDYVMDTYSNQYNPKYDNVSYVGHVSEVDQTLHTISFEFDSSTGKTPIALINWRNHPQFSSGTYKYVVSSDYINAFRYKMEQSGYRPAFFQGTGGNTQPTSRISGESGFSSNLKGGLAYGDLLADVTLECLKSNMTGVVTGKVRTMQNIYAEERVEYSEYHYKAALAAQAAEKAGTWPLTEEVYNSSTGKYEERTKADPYKYTYTDDNGEEQTICISCPSQADKIKEHYTNYSINGLKTIDLEIDTIMIGPEIAMVTCPGEPFDRYSQEAADKIKELWNDSNGVPVTYEEYYAIANQYNDWDNLQKIPNAQFGEPLILGYSNQHITYIPNALAYNYNAEHPELYSTNSYESFMTPLAEGGGERMVANLGDMLSEMVNGTQYCEHCEDYVVWCSLKDFAISEGYGHYYLPEDMSVAQQLIPANTMVCVDLREHTLSSSESGGTARVFYIEGNATLNIQDTHTTGTENGQIVGSCTGSGGAILTEEGSTLNIYGGELSATSTTIYGGVIWAKGTVNMYDGTISAGNASNSGDAISLQGTNASLNAYGGKITKNANGDCVAFRESDGIVTVAANAIVEEISYLSKPTTDTFKIVDSPVDKDTQTPFTGSVVLNANGITHGAYIGSIAVPWELGASVTISSGYDVVMNKDNQLVAETAVAGEAGVIRGEDIIFEGTLDDAIDNVGDGYVILGADVENLTVSSNITVDLNGKKVTNATATNGATLTLMDRKTGDYSIDDHIYGIVETISGNVVAADHYVAVTDDEGTSYHGYDMKLVSVTLRTGRNGMYYTSEFLGDAMVATQIESFGTALRIGKAPDESSMRSGTYSAFAPEAFGGESNSTILVDILKKANIVSTNKYNANLKVYGRSYIKWNDGSYEFTDVDEEQVYSLRTLTEKVSNTYSVDVLAENAELMEMYRQFSAVMVEWDIQNIRNAYAAG